MKVVYISSPYSTGDQAVNVKKQIDATSILIDEGFCPVTPLLTHFVHMCHPKSYEEWMAIDMELVKRSDCVLRLPGESKGADREVGLARSLGIPVYYDIVSIIEESLPPRPEFDLGDVVVWDGEDKVIGRLSIGPGGTFWYRFHDGWPRCYYIDDEHNDLSENHLRLANEQEIKILGDKCKIPYPKELENENVDGQSLVNV